MKQGSHTFFTFSVFFLLLLFSILAIASAIGTYRISVDGSKSLLQTKATDIALSIAFTLERLGLKKDLFSEILSGARWDDVAYLALYDKNSTIVLHSNPNLTGTLDENSGIIDTLKAKHISVHYTLLATGEKVFVLDFPLTLHTGGRSRVFCLRVALHPYPAEAIVRRANFQLALIGFFIVLLWGCTVFFLRFWKRVLTLEEELRAKERMAVLGEMAAVLAHEIRNPLSSIKGFAQVYQETAESKEEREDFSIIVSEARRLERLTTNLLTYSKPLKVRPAPFSLKGLCEELRREVDVRGEGSITLECSSDPGQVVLDREAVKQIALNLLQNAVSAAARTKDPSGPQVHMAFQIDGPVFKILVEDNGPGVPKELRDRIFDPFFTTKTKGTGLGLAIVRRLLDVMNGDIKIQSRDGKGTRVLVSMPLGGHERS